MFVFLRILSFLLSILSLLLISELHGVENLGLFTFLYGVRAAIFSDFHAWDHNAFFAFYKHENELKTQPVLLINQLAYAFSGALLISSLIFFLDESVDILTLLFIFISNVAIFQRLNWSNELRGKNLSLVGTIDAFILRPLIIILLSVFFAYYKMDNFIFWMMIGHHLLTTLGFYIIIFISGHREIIYKIDYVFRFNLKQIFEEIVYGLSSILDNILNNLELICLVR